VWVSSHQDSALTHKRIHVRLFDNRYYAFDDDYLRSQKVADSFYEEVQNEDEGNEELQNEDEGNGRCRRVSEHTLNFPSCNVVHELPLLEYSVKYLR
jgi:hypothetical protein